MFLLRDTKSSDASEAWTRGPSVSSQALYYCAPHVAAFVITFNSICNMSLNMTMFWKSKNFDSKGHGGGGGVWGQNMCYHAAELVVPFNLICNMTMFWKNWIVTFWQDLQGGGSAGKVFATM